jgi:choline dehydrogenase-like flavoprotein
MSFLDAREVPQGSEVEADVCIVGAGAAGLTIASELAGSPHRVILLESGGFSLDRETQALYDGENIGFPYYPASTIRLRFFGGTTNHWSGVCRPLDEVDFQERPWVPLSGWPIKRAELDPYYRRAHAICEVGRMDYDPGLWEAPEAYPLEFGASSLQTVMYRVSRPPTRFGQKFRSVLDEHSNVVTYLHGNAVDLETDASGSEIRRIRVRCLTGTEFRISARVFVLATGAVENARFLLHCLETGSLGPGPSRDWVGRCFMEHLSVVGGVLLPSDPALPTGLYQRRPSQEGDVGYGVLTVAPDAMAGEQILHSKIHLTPTSLGEGLKSVAPGVVAAAVAAQSGRLFEELADHVRSLIFEVDELAIFSYERMFRQRTAGSAYYLNYHLEHAPDPESRVTLSDDRDPLGMGRVRIRWKFGDLERRTLRRTNRLIASEVGAAGLGRVWEGPDDVESGWPVGLRGAWHQMGTTRMSDEPEAGVVDRHCRLHGIENLFVAGSSVFPTSGHANPTLTIVALALRLADQIKEVRVS